MKYILVAVIAVAVTATAFMSYLYFSSGMSSDGNNEASQEGITEEQSQLNARMGGLEKGINELKDILGQQMSLTQNLQEESLRRGAQIISLERKFENTIAHLQQILSENKGFAGASDLLAPGTAQPTTLEAAYESFSPELFQDPEFAKLFQEQVAQTIKEMQQKEREEQTARFTDRINDMVSQRVSEFVNAQNLNDYQQEELNKLVAERSGKTMDLFSKMRAQEVTADEFRTRMESLGNENNEKVKQVLLPEQYEEYKKIEQQFSRGGMMLGGGRNQPRQQSNPRTP